VTGKGLFINIIVYYTLEKYDLKVIPTEANEMSEAEESTKLMKISRLRPSVDGLRSK